MVAASNTNPSPALYTVKCTYTRRDGIVIVKFMRVTPKGSRTQVSDESKAAKVDLAFATKYRFDEIKKMGKFGYAIGQNMQIEILPA